jgi:hypothetical protein
MNRAIRHLSDAKNDFGDQWFTCRSIDFVKQVLFQERELLKPDRMPDMDHQLLESDVLRPRVRGNLFTDDVDPLTAEARFQEMGFETQPASQAL